MPPLTRASLESMKRVDLQRLCKDYGVKANLKTEALIELLLDAQGPIPRPRPQSRPPIAAPMTTRRSASLRTASRETAQRKSSMIIHDIPEEEEEDSINLTAQFAHIFVRETTRLSANSFVSPAPVTPRTRKAKETQRRLGVGKPKVAGGDGPRAVTRSLSLSKEKHKNNQSLGTTEDDTTTEESQRYNGQLGAVPLDGHFHQARSIVDVDVLIAKAMKPLLEQVETLKTEVEQMQFLRSEISRLKNRLVQTEGLQSKVDQLTFEFKELRSQPISAISYPEPLKADQPRTPEPGESATKKHFGPGVGFPLQFQRVMSASSSSTPFLGQPRPLELVIGKRARDLVSGMDLADGGIDQQIGGDGDEQAPKKRKTGEDISVDQCAWPDGENSKKARLARVPVFAMFSDPGDETNLLPTFPQHYFEGSSPSPEPSTSRQSTKRTIDHDNQTSYEFSFLPIAATPTHNMYLSSFPYPEPPQSPTPGGPNMLLSAYHQERADIFQKFGLPPPSRTRLPTTVNAQPEGDTVDPLALIRGIAPTTKRYNASSAELASLGPATTLKVSSSRLDPPPIQQRTMYGTELDDDTRFGEFGVEGIANEFWTRGQL